MAVAAPIRRLGNTPFAAPQVVWSSMGFKVGKAYSRAKITAELGIDRDMHIVLVADGELLAIVANTNGFNRLNGKQYRNELTEHTFAMLGENDGRGSELEVDRAVRLFYAHDDDGYRYEGKVKWTQTTESNGVLRREFQRIAEQPAGARAAQMVR